MDITFRAPGAGDQEKSMHRLDGKVAIVTGGAGGIGRGYALRLARLGADVAILDLDLAISRRHGELLTAADVVEEVRALGVRSVGVEADLSDRPQAEAAIRRVVEDLGGIDVLVNNAGGAIAPFERSSGADSPEQDTALLFNANFFTTVNCCQAAIPHLRARRGVIVNISTICVDVVDREGKYAMYGAAKAAVLRYSRNLAVELGPDGIRVNCIAPGITETARVKASAAARGIGTSDQATAIPLRRFASVDDMLGPLQFLVTDMSAYVTGECIRVSGGMTLVGP
jgi:3-oxoacyl-[acyl-carrier protein] reductase